jgi:hypothetical protein
VAALDEVIKMLFRLAAVILSVAGVTAGAPLTPNCSQNCEQDSLAFAFEVSLLQSEAEGHVYLSLHKYGFPLYAYGRFAETASQTNVVYNEKTLSNASSTSVVRPNADTLYSTIFLDLALSNVVITIPHFDDRFWLFPFYDMYILANPN